MNSTAIALNTEAINHVQKGEFAEAITCLKCAIKMEDSFVLRLNLGLTYRDSGNFRKAKTALEKALELKGDDICALEELSLVCLKLEEFEEAVEYCYTALQLAPENAHLWNTFGIIHFAQHDLSNAADFFEEAVTLNPYYYDAFFNLRDTYDELGNKAGKEECIKKMAELQKSGLA